VTISARPRRGRHRWVIGWPGGITKINLAQRVERIEDTEMPRLPAVGAAKGPGDGERVLRHPNNKAKERRHLRRHPLTR
jgi:hypothetical protein